MSVLFYKGWNQLFERNNKGIRWIDISRIPKGEYIKRNTSVCNFYLECPLIFLPTFPEGCPVYWCHRNSKQQVHVFWESTEWTKKLNRIQIKTMHNTITLLLILYIPPVFVSVNRSHRIWLPLFSLGWYLSSLIPNIISFSRSSFMFSTKYINRLVDDCINTSCRPCRTLY